MKNWITTEITEALNKNNQLPLIDLLRNSLFYPAAGFDGSPLRHANVLKVNSFIFVDNLFYDETTLEKHINDFPVRGYHIYGIKDLQQSDLISNGWKPQVPQQYSDSWGSYLNNMKLAGESPTSSYARWIVFERDEPLTDEHGPSSISLIFIRGEGIATYQALYIQKKVLPRVFAIIRPGTMGFGGNFQSFNQTLNTVMLMHDLGLPQYILNWHPKGCDVHIRVDHPWRNIYREKIGSTLSKDGEFDFKISLWSLATPLTLWLP